MRLLQRHSRHRSLRRSFYTALVIAILALVGACTGGSAPDEDPPSVQELADGELAGGQAVDRVEVDESPADGTVDVAVVMVAGATAAQAGEVADEARAFAERHRKRATSRWTSQLYVGEPGSSTVQVEIYPTVDESAGKDVVDAFALSSLPGVTSASFAGGTPYVEVGEVADVAALVPALRASPAWDEGGSVHAGDDRLRITDEPRRVTTAQLEAIARASDRYPDGSFAVEAAATGDRYPEVFVNHVTSDQAAEITRTFTDASLASDNAEGYELDFTMRSASASDPNATVDSAGTFGRRG